MGVSSYNMSSPAKNISIRDLCHLVENLKNKGKKVVQSHGVFDIIHPGILHHLHEAKDMGDILVVTIIRDKDVRRGPGRPIFSDNLRAQNVQSLEFVDYVCVVNDREPFESVRRIKPDFLVRGQETHEREKEIYGDIIHQNQTSRLGTSQVVQTSSIDHNSSLIIKNFLDIYSDETKNFLQHLAGSFSFNDVLDHVNSLSNLKVLVIGDAIIDEYHYCLPMGKSAKAQVVVNKYLSKEVFAGGIFAIANHVAGICNDVTLVTLLGNECPYLDFINSNLKKNIAPEFYFRENGPTVVKKRYVDRHSNQKLFEINFLEDQYVKQDRVSSICEYLTEKLPKCDLVLVSDFGHGFIAPEIIETLEKYSHKLAVNTQTNAANSGFNMVKKYRSADFVCLDEIEARLAVQKKYENIEEIARELYQSLGVDELVITLGKKGSLGINSEKIHFTPIFSSRVVDSVGAGDAVFSFAAPCFAAGTPLELTTFIGNAIGALAVQIICNKKSVEKFELLEFVSALMK